MSTYAASQGFKDKAKTITDFPSQIEVKAIDKEITKMEVKKAKADQKTAEEAKKVEAKGW